jgi:anti-sigma B factor antagonist
VNLLDVSSAMLDGRAILALTGELDLSTVPEAETSLQQLATQSGTSPIVLDLRELTFMDSTGLRFILAAEARARETNRPFVIVRGPQPVHRVFRLAMLEERLAFADSPDDAPGPTANDV